MYFYFLVSSYFFINIKLFSLLNHNFLFYFSEKEKFILKFKFVQLAEFFFLTYQKFENSIICNLFFQKILFINIKQWFPLIFFNYFFIIKKRFRISGRGFGLEIFGEDGDDFFDIEVGFSTLLKFIKTLPLRGIKTSRKKKKIIINGIFMQAICNIVNFICNFRYCEPYKHKGFRLYKNKVRYKKGKKSLR